MFCYFNEKHSIISTSPRGSVGSKKRWTAEDKEAVINLFKPDIQTRTALTGSKKESRH